MNADLAFAKFSRAFRLAVLVVSGFVPAATFAQDDPFGADAGKPAQDAPAAAAPAAQKKPDVIRKVEDTSIRKMELLPYQKKELIQRLVKEIQMHLDVRETVQAQAKLDELLEVEMTDSELRDIRRRFSRFLVVEMDQRVLEMRRRKPTGAVNLIEAVRRMLDINRLDEANRYFALLTANPLNEKDRADIYGRVGESFLKSLIRDAKLGAEGVSFARNVLDAATSGETARSPVVQVLRSTRLNTPADQLDAIDKLLRYGATNDAKEIAEQLAKREMTPEEMADLHRQVGSGPLLMLVRDKRLGDAPSAFALKVLDTSSTVSRDPARLAEAVKKLQSGDIAAKRAALGDLARGGEAAAAAVVKAAATESKTEWLEKTLAQLDESAIGPLVAARQASEPQIRELAARSLARIDRPELRIHLLRPLFDDSTSLETKTALEKLFVAAGQSIPSQDIAVQRLRREWDGAFDALRPGVAEFDLPAHEWVWSDTDKELTYKEMTEGQSRRWRLAQVASDLLTVAPQDADAQRLAAISYAEAAAADAPGFELDQGDSWAGKQLGSVPVKALEQALAEASRRQRIFALLGLLQVIAKSGDESLLIPTAGEQRILTKLLGHPHPRVRAQAVDTVLKLLPTTTFAGSSQLVEALRGFITLRARPNVIVLDPKPSRARQAAMFLRQAGWEAESFFNEQDLTSRLADLPETQIILVSEETTNLNEFLQRARREPRLALTPIGVMANVDNLPGANFFAEFEGRKQVTDLGGLGVNAETMLPAGLQNRIENPKKPKDWLNLDRMTRVVPYPMSADVLARIILQLSQLNADAPLTPDDQLSLAVQSARWMKYISGNPSLARIFDLGAIEAEAISALNSDVLAVDVAPVVGFLGTAKSQEALVNLANQDQRELPQRQAAASAFKTAVENRGLLLTKGAIAAQYDRYNQSRDTDPAIRNVLGSVLDAIEIPWKKRQALSASEPR